MLTLCSWVLVAVATVKYVVTCVLGHLLRFVYIKNCSLGAEEGLVDKAFVTGLWRSEWDSLEAT